MKIFHLSGFSFLLFFLLALFFLTSSTSFSGDYTIVYSQITMSGDVSQTVDYNVCDFISDFSSLTGEKQESMDYEMTSIMDEQTGTSGINTWMLY